MGNVYDHICAVIGAKKKSDGDIEIIEVFGTATKIKDDIFITAGHVLEAIEQFELKALLFRYPDESNFRYEEIVDTEIFSGEDIGLIRCPIPHMKKDSWKWDKCNVMDDVYASGFPYGLNVLEHSVQSRSFKGYVVSDIRHIHHFNNKPSGYELSFQAPRGLSGATLLDAMHNVVGIVVGNIIQEIIVYSEKEYDKLNGETTVYEKVETLHLGIAVRSAHIGALHSKMLNKTIKDYINN